MEEETPAAAYDGRRAAALAVACVTVLVTLIVAWAATVGPGTVLEGEGFGTLGSPTPTVSTSSPTASAPPEGGEPQSGDLPLLLQVMAIVMAVGVVLAILVVLALGVRYLLSLRPAQRVRRSQVDFEVLDSPDAADAVAAAMAADAATQLMLLREGSPRNGIVACWARFEEQAARAGVRPEPWETSSEFALRILELVEADTSAVAALAELFREARFSEHEVTERQRTAAIDLLVQIHASLGGRRAGVGS